MSTHRDPYSGTSCFLVGKQLKAQALLGPLEGPGTARPHPWVTPDQDLVLQIPNLNESFETSQADLGVGGDGQGVAHGASGGQLCPDAGCGCQVPKSQSPGQTPSDEALLVRKQLAGEDTVLMVL